MPSASWTTPSSRTRSRRPTSVSRRIQAAVDEIASAPEPHAGRSRLQLPVRGRAPARPAAKATANQYQPARPPPDRAPGQRPSQPPEVHQAPTTRPMGRPAMATGTARSHRGRLPLPPPIRHCGVGRGCLKSHNALHPCCDLVAILVFRSFIIIWRPSGL